MTRHRLSSRLAPLVVAAAVTPVLAFAQPQNGRGAPKDDAGKPWAVGVTPAQRTTAEQLLAEGNRLCLESKHREALA